MAWFWAHSGIPFALATITRATGNQPLRGLVTLLSSPSRETLSATCLIGSSTLVLLRGLPTLMKLQRWLFGFGVAGMLVVFALMFLSSRTDFQMRFDAMTGPGTYQKMIVFAETNNLGGRSWAWFPLCRYFPCLPLPALFAVTTNWFAGELTDIQSPRKSLLNIVGAVAILVAVTWVLNWAMRKSMGADFLAAITYLYFTGSSQYPLPSDPNYFHLTSLLTTSPLLACLIGLGWLAWCTMWTPGNMVFAIRLFFSWSVDKLVPTPLARVSSVRHTPVVATIVVACLLEAFLVASRFGNMFNFFVAASFMVNVAMTLTCFSAILFPFRLRQVYVASPVRFADAGIPVVSILGLLAAVTMILTDIQFVTVREFGVAHIAPLAYVSAIRLGLDFLRAGWRNRTSSFARTTRMCSSPEWFSTFR